MLFFPFSWPSSWIKNPSCSSPSLHSSSSFPAILEWLIRLLFLSPCPQRALFSSLDLLFLLSLLFLALRNLLLLHRNSNPATERPNRTMTLWFKLTVSIAVVMSFSSLVFCVLALAGDTKPQRMTNLPFWLLRTITHAVIVAIIVRERLSGADIHLLPLRIFWGLNFLITSLSSISSFIHLNMSYSHHQPGLMLDDIFSFMSLPLGAVLTVVAVRGKTGIVPSDFSEIESEDGEIDTETVEISSKFENVSVFASASLISKAFWLWMIPLLRRGHKSPLKLEDVPMLSPEHNAETLSQLFESKWPQQNQKPSHPVRTTLLRCFWKEVTFTALLAVVRLCVMYVGPILIQGFIDFASGKRSSSYEGYYLMFTLLTAKFIEVLSTHHFSFQSQKLGMLVRSTLITALYKKGLKLSCSARQDHGVGQMVNYLAVDAQQLATMMPQLHAIWLVPLQTSIAFILLYRCLGASLVTAIVGLCGISTFVFFETKNNNRFQSNQMKSRDSRMMAMNEMLNNMRVIKFQAWEEHFNERIQKLRESEFKWLSKFLYSVTGNSIVLWSTPLLLSALTFGTAAFMGVRLDAGTVFTATTIFQILQEPIRTFPQSMISFSQAMISLERLDNYMTSEELKDDIVERDQQDCNGTVAVEIREGNFSWDDENRESVLKNINFVVNRGELTAVVGTVGSGKSSLLASVLGEMRTISGKVSVCGTTAYVAQTPWIQNGTVQENILFGMQMDAERYKEILRVCCLDKDLEMMESGDQTEIGERGINLSGGQKQRVQLARAVYQDCDIYFLDDVFSAVDAHTGSYIFKECIRGLLRDKTILLVTHQVDFLHNIGLILVMRDGMIVQSGKYNELLSSGMDFRELVAAHERSMELVEAGATIQTSNDSKRQKSPLSGSNSREPDNSKRSTMEPKATGENSKLIKEEEKETGQVSLDIYKLYCTEAYGWCGVTMVLLLSLLLQASAMASDYWLAYETSEKATSFNAALFIWVYAIITAVSIVLVLIRSTFVTRMGLKTTQILFKRLLNSIFHAPMSFFDTTPSGRVLSRASTDQTNVDVFIPFMMGSALAMYVRLLSIIIITCQYAWPTVFFLIPLGYLNLWYRRYYLATSRELTRLDSITRAPIIHHFSESMTGVMTIRSFRMQDRFCEDNINHVNANLRIDFHNYASNEWFSFRLELIGSCILCFSTLFMILLPSNLIKPENVGLSLSYGLPLNSVLFWAVYLSCFVENKMISVERIKQFVDIPSEANWTIDGRFLPLAWPSRGHLHVQDLQVRYRPGSPLILRGITLSIDAGEKIGVVGRTGSGKSTLIQAFFRLVEPSAGKIIVDGIDISSIGLHQLRSRFGIIPQEPLLFQGTIRTNIDPTGRYSDEEIWRSLERCQLKDVVASKPGKLDSLVIDTGENWSVGQRQLLCLGRVLLKHSRLLFMDEATASVDSQTDAVIQKIIREDFAACTVISIAHRIPTVMDCDRVLVIDAGRAEEFDQPSRLLERQSLFGALVQEYAHRSAGL